MLFRSGLDGRGHLAGERLQRVSGRVAVVGVVQLVERALADRQLGDVAEVQLGGGAAVLLDAYRRLCADNLPLRLLIAGDGAEPVVQWMNGQGFVTKYLGPRPGSASSVKMLRSVILKGIEALAHHVVDVADSGQANYKPLYPDEMPLWDKIRTVAQTLYGAKDIDADASVKTRIKDLQEGGYGHYPICMAKTQYSFSTDAAKKGAPSGHVVNVREVRVSAGAEFLVFICGEIMTMPGLPKVPAANSIEVNAQGKIVGLF